MALGEKLPPGLDQETNMVWLDLKKAGATVDEFVNLAREGVHVFDGRIVTHYRNFSQRFFILYVPLSSPSIQNSYKSLTLPLCFTEISIGAADKLKRAFARASNLVRARGRIVQPKARRGDIILGRGISQRSEGYFGCNGLDRRLA